MTEIPEELTSRRVAIKQRDAQLLARKLMYARIGGKVEVRIQDGSTLTFKIYTNKDS